MGKLTDMKVKNAKPGIHGDGDGLYLRVKPPTEAQAKRGEKSGAKSWVLRVQHMGRRTDIGLGGFPTDLTLREARDKAHHLRKLARQGKNAIAERDREKVVIPTFADAVGLAHAELSKGWSEKHGDAFKASLNEHAVPKLGAKRVDQITTAEVIAALSPIWTEKPAIASKVRVRIMQVLSFARAKGWRTAPLPEARELRNGLARQPKGKNFTAMDWREVPAFFSDQLAREDTAGRLALLFTITTAARSGEARSARWEHIDIEARTWTRPGELMKSGVKHVVTLNDAAIGILERARPLSGGEGLIFPGTKGQKLSDMTLSKVMRTAKRDETVHGFRSSFRDWAAERMPTIPAMVAEMALAHSVGTKTEQAYLRTDLPDMRRALMDGWGQFLAESLSSVGGNVVWMERA
ncbi:integrase arm-type DNA-binding domain-containing protein [Sphingobium sp. WTD-1]|uniref:tyrosine-type recombinase/integrase n=1 Tax=Sphingobium sp. WTD-1 TaxID=2979467 RepID=UPI0024DEFAE7|nr:site-specific integrase [Sphingobium sp. WTD-1]WIA57631.1 integrase arm-type DNA-binding domain-containing protein [Sphingobium sp. WTD-1]